MLVHYGASEHVGGCIRSTTRRLRLARLCVVQASQLVMFSGIASVSAAEVADIGRVHARALLRQRAHRWVRLIAQLSLDASKSG